MSIVTYATLQQVITGMGNKLRDNLWQASKDYRVGDFVIHNEKIYRVKTAHTSGSSFNDSNLTALSIDKIKTWAANTAYIVEDVVIYNNNLYQCKTANSDASWTSSHWQIIGGSSGSGGAGIKEWKTGTSYLIGELVLQNDSIYKCKTGHTSNTWKADYANWQLIGMIKDWLPLTDYIEGDIIAFENQLYKVTSTFTSGSAFSDTDLEKYVPSGLTQTQIAALINIFNGSGGGGSAGLEDWQANTAYTTGDLLVYEGVIYKVNADFTSGATFSDTNLDMYVPNSLTTAQITALINAFNI